MFLLRAVFPIQTLLWKVLKHWHCTERSVSDRINPLFSMPHSLEHKLEVKRPHHQGSRFQATPMVTWIIQKNIKARTVGLFIANLSLIFKLFLIKLAFPYSYIKLKGFDSFSPPDATILLVSNSLRWPKRSRPAVNEMKYVILDNLNTICKLGQWRFR